MKYWRGWVIAVVALSGMVVARGQEAVPAWREKFDQVYRLEEEEVLKRIPPPFIAERMDYYRSEHSSQAQAIPRGPDYLCFHWTGHLRNWGLGFVGGGGLTLEGVMDTVLKLENYEFEGPKALLTTKLKGDWIVNPDAEREKTLPALAAIFEAVTKRKLEFVREKVERDVVVASGDWTFDTNQGRATISLHAYDEAGDEGGGGGSGTMDEFFVRLGSQMNVRVIDETSTKANSRFQWRTHRSSHISKIAEGPKREEQRTRLLEVVSEQTGVKFEMEKREVEVWMVREKK
jgi:uncharacterized protein (TIGR03435 family)